MIILKNMMTNNNNIIFNNNIRIRIRREAGGGLWILLIRLDLRRLRGIRRFLLVRVGREEGWGCHLWVYNNNILLRV